MAHLPRARLQELVKPHALGGRSWEGLSAIGTVRSESGFPPLLCVELWADTQKGVLAES